MQRVLIVFDGKAWFVRQVRVIEHDLDRDEKVYRCDQPVGAAFSHPEDALLAATRFVGLPKRRGRAKRTRSIK